MLFNLGAAIMTIMCSGGRVGKSKGIFLACYRAMFKKKLPANVRQ